MKVDIGFGETRDLHLQSRVISRALLATCLQAGSLLGLLFDLDDGGDMFL
jgi:hypothetical protein